MAHNINRTNGKDSIVWAGKTPWHRLGTQLPEAFTAAQKFVGTFPNQEDSAKWRDYLRSFCVPGLRWLWRNGDHATRTTIAARVAVWRGRSTEEVRQLQERIRVRETGRKGGK